MATMHLSPRQWRLLQLLSRRDITHEESLYVYQGTLGSFARETLSHARMIIETEQGYGLSEEGREVLTRYQQEELMKERPSQQLSKWLRVHKVMRRRRASA